LKQIQILITMADNILDRFAEILSDYQLNSNDENYTNIHTVDIFTVMMLTENFTQDELKNLFIHLIQFSRELSLYGNSLFIQQLGTYNHARFTDALNILNNMDIDYEAARHYIDNNVQVINTDYTVPDVAATFMDVLSDFTTWVEEEEPITTTQYELHQH